VGCVCCVFGAGGRAGRAKDSLKSWMAGVVGTLGPRFRDGRQGGGGRLSGSALLLVRGLCCEASRPVS